MVFNLKEGVIAGTLGSTSPPAPAQSSPVKRSIEVQVEQDPHALQIAKSSIFSGFTLISLQFKINSTIEMELVMTSLDQRLTSFGK